MDSSGILKLDLKVSRDNLQEDAKKVIAKVCPDWDLQSLKFKVFTGGITNTVLGCHVGDDLDDLVLVRVNGEGSGLTIDRDGEPEVMQALHAAGCASPIHGIFDNGMVYGFFPGETLDEKTVRDPHIQELIAEEVGKMHQVRLSSMQKEMTERPVSQYPAKMKSWLDYTPTHFDNPDKQKMFETEVPSVARLRKELDKIVETLEALHMDVVLSHNDLLPQNIIYNNQEDRIHFIDYEYAFYNYEAFDIACHFVEYAGMGEPDYNLCPSRAEQLTWLRHFLETKAKGSSESAGVTDTDVETLYVQVNKCTCAALYMWGLWFLINSAIDFDYLGHASIRFKEYFKRKEQFFNPKVTK